MPAHARARAERPPMTAARAIATMLVALALGSLLGAASLERVAERQPYGTGRDIALEITKPLKSFSHALFLDRPREWLASLTGHEDQPTSSLLLAATTTTTSTTTTTTVPVSTTVTTLPAPTTTTLPRHRVATADAPVKVWMGGDSLMGTVSEAYGRATGSDARVNMTTDVQVGTGLARPDVLDWASELTDQLNANQPDVVVLSFGANDDQPLHAPDGTYDSLYTPEWEAEYARRVGVIMDIASASGARQVIWLGLPTERPDQLNNVKDAMNDAAKAEAAKRPDVHFVDLHPIFDAPDGSYTDDITRPDGTPITARARDGVHLSEDGADVLAPVIVQLIAAEWGLS